MLVSIIAIFFLLIISIIDLKTFNLEEGSIPAVLTTIFLIVVFIFNPGNAIVYGLLAALFSLLLVDLDLFKGVADVKVFTAVGMTFQSVIILCYYALIMLFLTVIIQSVIKILIKKKKIKKIVEIPYIPIMFAAYMIILMIQIKMGMF